MRALINIVAILLFFITTAFLTQDTTDEVMDCASKAGPSAIYLKDFQVKLPAAVPGQRPPMFRQAIVLRGNNIYRFNLCNKQGEAILRIYDSSRMILTTYDPAKQVENNPISFFCKKTGPYNIVISFKEGKAGESIGVMSHVNTSGSKR